MCGAVLPCQQVSLDFSFRNGEAGSTIMLGL